MIVLQNLLPVFLTMIPMVFLDDYLRTVKYYIPNHRWCCIHSIVNGCVVMLTIIDTLTLLSSDKTIQQTEHVAYLHASRLVMALHIYHVLAFKVDQTAMIAHHIVMMPILCIPFINHGNNMFIMFCNYSLFFLCGLPGCIDYYCMHLCYSKRMKRLDEKSINTWLNTWVRAPGILYAAFFVYRQHMNGMLDLFYTAAVVITFVWNAQFWSSATSISYGYNLAKDHT